MTTPRCVNYLHVLEALDTKHPHPEHVEAMQHMCGGCPLQPQCWEDNKRQRWLVNIQGAQPAELGTRQQRRADTLADAIADGLGVAEVTAALDTTATALREWCRKYRQMHLWTALKDAQTGGTAA